MTQGHGQMRQIYPETGEAYRYRIREGEGYFTFQLEGEVLEGLNTAITLNIELRQAGEGLCRTESGRTHAFAWAWVGSELHLWLDGALLVFQRPETRRRGATPHQRRTRRYPGPHARRGAGGAGQRGGPRGAKPDPSGN